MQCLLFSCVNRALSCGLPCLPVDEEIELIMKVSSGLRRNWTRAGNGGWRTRVWGVSEGRGHSGGFSIRALWGNGWSDNQRPERGTIGWPVIIRLVQ